MPPLGKKSVYVDTNEFVYARALELFPPRHRKLQYYRSGKKCLRVLNACRKRKIVIMSSMISRIELWALHLDWSKRKRLVELKMPLGFAFGESHRGDDQVFVRDLFTPEERSEIYEELDNWFKSWHFNSLVRWKTPGEIPFWGELTEMVLRYSPRGRIADALHVGAAIGLQCNNFFTSDGELRTVIHRMREDRTLLRELKSRKMIADDYNLPDAITDSNGL